METQTLEQLKAENAAAEDSQAEIVGDTTDEVKADEVETETEQTTESDDDSGTEESEAWQKSEDEGTEGARQQVPVAAVEKLRAKLKGRINERDTEIQELKAQVAELAQTRVSSTGQAVPTVGARPKPEDYDDDDAYYVALDVYDAKRIEAALKQSRSVSDREEAGKHQAAQVEEKVRQHYGRAAEIAEKSGIGAEAYQAADLAFRTLVEDVFPGKGDVFADNLISRMGEGSEKLIYYLDRNKVEQGRLRESLAADPTALDAAMLLGNLMAKKVNAPAKKTSRAPAPAANANGDAHASPDASSLKRAYQKAGDAQSRVDARIAAGRKGIDVSNWQ